MRLLAMLLLSACGAGGHRTPGEYRSEWLSPYKAWEVCGSAGCTWQCLPAYKLETWSVRDGGTQEICVDFRAP